MTYNLKSVTIRANNDRMTEIDELWQDIMTGKIPLLFDQSQEIRKGIFPIARYSNYESDETGDYDLSIMAVTPEFISQLDDDKYQKYDVVAENIGECAKQAWTAVWQDSQKGVIKRSFTQDYEVSLTPQTSGDGQFHCLLFIAVK
ncbi:hypothetical protein [Xylocopilactobacillus apicola]|uniref:AraC family transcriptional regulator n=1 Tax=Xylocopilactobacillus apicola TaxID=2932184 RepID=A0AAU9CYK9_9LACO|nr:hypothetical protein [Xylocopilactobacillus apicola]BDR59092.1 AraC family transcriptional regulator [Xylocopilactobacillus apicola]